MKIEEKLRQIVQATLTCNIDQGGYYGFESKEVEPTGFCGDEYWVRLPDNENYDNRAKSCQDDECFEAVMAKCEAIHEDTKGVFFSTSAQGDFDYLQRCCHCGAVVNFYFTDEFFGEIYEEYFKDFSDYLPCDDSLSLYLDSYHFENLSVKNRTKILLHIIAKKVASTYKKSTLSE